mmetsp:Transcript_6040/g.14674  ORF Transcript_6040/g.14674 Transcript_6040/m.14674 type:complete len:432 (+) Transcript_6040:153-1448(+)|eukprot:CAMPEP_0113881272 /NCGR_PEP_ID=MMETSP0780_2-20120614/8279_1 /TAXON_ID=652834 /ORGANISM="Palpitomonas bilix" /LENGTH=431 /DNA_ID=CAMNT_0000868101 /DNA_START=106 /DNA_END=1401 /DNA_ORIENTATION=- /assembly_acc=CAM_ASM_000599
MVKGSGEGGQDLGGGDGRLLNSSYYGGEDDFQNFGTVLAPGEVDQPHSFFDALSGSFGGGSLVEPSVPARKSPHTPSTPDHQAAVPEPSEPLTRTERVPSPPAESVSSDDNGQKKEKRAKIHREAEKRRRQKIEESLQAIISLLPSKSRLSNGLERGKKAEALRDVALEIKAMKDKLKELEAENELQKQRIVDMKRQQQQNAVAAYPAPFLGRADAGLGEGFSAAFLPSVFEVSGIPTVVVGPSSCRIAAVNSSFRQLFGVHYRERKQNGEAMIERDTREDQRKPTSDVASQPPCELSMQPGKVDDQCQLVPIAKTLSASPSPGGGMPLVPVGAYVRSDIDEYSGDTVYVVVSMSDIVHKDDRPMIVAATRELEKQVMEDQQSGRSPETRSRRVPARFNSRNGLITALTTLSVMGADSGGMYCVIQLTPIS